MSKKDNKKRQFIIFGLCSFIALVLCLVTLVITVDRVERADKTAQAQERSSKTVLQNDSEALTEYILKLTQHSNKNKFVKADFRTEVTIDDGTVKIDGDSSKAQLFVYVKNKVVSSIDDIYGEDVKGVFGTVSSYMPLLDLSELNSLHCQYSQGQADENGDPVLDDEGNLIDADYYFLTFTVDGSSVVGEKSKRAFYSNESLDVEKSVKEALLPDCSIDFKEIKPLEYVINTKVNRFTDEIVSVEIQRNFNVRADMEFLNSLSVFGKRNVEFNYTVKEIYDYKYAGIKFSENSFKAEAGDELSLTVNAVIENESEYKVTFISSDESIATVDEMGYVQILKAEPVTITVKLNYLGEVFEDVCYINAPSADN
jgi:uncharacterized protein YjdB